MSVFRMLVVLGAAMTQSCFVGLSSYGGVVSFGSGLNSFSMEFVSIGNPVNVGDTTGNPNPAGSVGYQYEIGKYEISRDVIVKASAAGGLGISMNDMSLFGGNGLNRPATGVSWNEAARFVNWLNTSTGGFSAYKFSTAAVNDPIALWTPADTLDYNPNNPFRSLRANYVLPTSDEWFKAAYFNPITGTYFDYPTGSNSAPGIVTSGTVFGTAVYSLPLSQGPSDVTQAGGLSPFMTVGQGGNVQEWEETAFDLVNNLPTEARGIRGGAWGENSVQLSVGFRSSQGSPSLEFSGVGFRVVSLLPVTTVVPEPNSLTIWLVSLCTIIAIRRSRK